MQKNNFDFNHRIILQKEVHHNDESGEINLSFNEIAKVWANINPIHAIQNFANLKQDTEITHLIKIRYLEEAKQCKRITFGKRTFSVLSVFCPNETYEILVFHVKEMC